MSEGVEGELYTKLTQHFDRHFSDPRGFTYVTGEQVTSRLNDVLGVAGWSFRVIEHGHDEASDEMWCLGELSIWPGGATVTRQQFGSQKVKRPSQESIDRGREDVPIDIGFDKKGATTDALKKCASMFGIGLYLSEKSGGVQPPSNQQQQRPPQQQQAPRTQAPAQQQAPTQQQQLPSNQANQAPTQQVPPCEVCQEALLTIEFKDKTVWTPQRLADQGRSKFGHVLCMPHYREANAAKNSGMPYPFGPQPAAAGASADLDSIPF